MMNDRYLIQNIVGEGTFGQTMKAVDQKTNCTVAVKYIKDVSNISNVDEIDNEVKILKLLNCSTLDGRDNIVNLIDMFAKENHPCYVLEFLPHTLDGILKQRRLSASELKYIGYSLAQSLAFMCDMGIVHADLKPDNIMFTDSGELKVVDFGMSFFESDRNCDLCQSRNYRAPEVCLYLDFGCAIDVWSIGCILAECKSRKVLLKSKNELHHFQLMAELFGMLPDEMIESCPVKSGYFTEVEGKWRIKDSCHRFLGASTKSLASVLHMKNTTPNEIIFVDLLEKMFHIEPKKRIRAVEVLKHPFFAQFDPARVRLQVDKI